MTQLVKNPIHLQCRRPPAAQETRVQSLDQEVPREKEMATHSSILAWEIPWREEPGGLEPMGSQELDMTERLNHNPTTPAGLLLSHPRPTAAQG